MSFEISKKTRCARDTLGSVMPKRRLKRYWWIRYWNFFFRTSIKSEEKQHIKHGRRLFLFATTSHVIYWTICKALSYHLRLGLRKLYEAKSTPLPVTKVRNVHFYQDSNGDVTWLVKLLSKLGQYFLLRHISDTTTVTELPNEFVTEFNTHSSTMTNVSLYWIVSVSLLFF